MSFRMIEPLTNLNVVLKSSSVYISDCLMKTLLAMMKLSVRKAKAVKMAPIGTSMGHILEWINTAMRMLKNEDALSSKL